MPTDYTDLPEPTDPDTSDTTDDTPVAEPRIVEWVAEVPRRRRATDFDGVIDEVRGAGAGKWAIIAQGEKNLTANRVSSLKKRYSDISFTQSDGKTYATVKA